MLQDQGISYTNRGVGIFGLHTASHTGSLFPSHGGAQFNHGLASLPAQSYANPFPSGSMVWPQQ